MGINVNPQKTGAGSDTVPSATATFDQLTERLKKIGAKEPTPEQAAAEAHQKGENEVRKLAAKRGIRYGPDRCSLERFEVYDQKQRVVLAALAGIVERLDTVVTAGDGLILYGTAGTGKDHLLTAILYAVARSGRSVGWVNGQEVFGDFRDRMDSGKTDEEAFRALCAPDVLGISDLIPTAGKVNAWDLGYLYRLLDRRYCNLKPTWVSLNALTLEELDGHLTTPIADRLREGATALECKWQSFRERKKGGKP